jgi:CHASE3 domain sensor protein
MTLRQRVLASFLVAVVGAVLASVQIASVLHETHGADRAVTTTWTPASGAVNQLIVHLAGQQTAERGFVITGDTDFLVTYTAGRDQVERDLATLHSTIGSEPALGSDLAAVEQQWRHWLSDIAEPEIASTKSGDTVTSQRLVAAELGDRVFASVWSKVSAL